MVLTCIPGGFGPGPSRRKGRPFGLSTLRVLLHFTVKFLHTVGAVPPSRFSELLGFAVSTGSGQDCQRKMRVRLGPDTITLGV